MPVLTVEKPLREQLGDEAVDSLVRLINRSREEQKNGILEFVEEKFERRMSEEISDLEVRLIRELSDIEKRLSAQIAAGDEKLAEKIAAGDKALFEKISDLETKLSDKITGVEKKVSDSKADLIKWMFIFWIGQMAMILSILFTFFKK